MADWISYNRSGALGNEITYIQQAIQNLHLSGDGPFTKKCHAFLEKELGIKRALLTTSCTHALEMAAILLDTQAGDEIIVPDYTFVSSINPFVLRGGIPVFADIRPDTLNIDEAKLESLFTERTKAIVVVHYAGISCEMDTILELAKTYQVPVIEDNAHGLFGLYRNRFLGTIGTLGTLSFHETKNFTCGEGGALLVNQGEFIERAEIIREKGTNRNSFLRGEVEQYTWVDIGSSYLPSEILSAFLYAQFEKKAEIQRKRSSIWTRYSQELGGWAEREGVKLPTVPEYCEHPSHLFYLVMPSLSVRQKFIRYMAENHIDCVFHYLPLHLSQMGKRYGGQIGQCPVAESVSDRLVRLPLYPSLSPSDQLRVIEKVQNFTVRDPQPG